MADSSLNPSEATDALPSKQAQPGLLDSWLGPLLLWLSTATLLPVAVLIIQRPFAGRVALHNILTIGLLLAVGVLLAGAATLVRSARDWWALTAHALLAGFLVRSLPNLMLAHPQLHDGYFYFVSLLNIINGESFAPTLSWWYEDVARQLHWPLLQHLTAQIHVWTGIPSEQLWRFLPPALGALTFVSIGLVAYQVFANWRVAAYAGLLGSLSDLVLYYQAQYQPQGTAIVIFTFFIFTVLVSRAERGPGPRIILLLVGAAFLCSHHASSLVAPLMLWPLLLGSYVTVLWRRFRPAGNGQVLRFGDRLMHEATRLATFESVVMLLFVVSITRHLYLSSDILDLAARNLDPSNWMEGILSGSDPVIWWINALRTTKYVLFALGLVGMAIALRRPQASTLVLAALALGLITGGTGASLIMRDASPRFLAVWFPFIAIFAALALHSLAGSTQTLRRIGQGGAVLMVAAYTTTGVINSQVPALFLEGTPRSPGVWYGNSKPHTEELALAGRWLGAHTPAQARYAVDFATRMAPFFYGQRSDRQLVYAMNDSRAYCLADYIVVDYLLDTGPMAPQVTIDYQLYPRIYDNGTVAIYRRLWGPPCSVLAGVLYGEMQ